jgi:hypothetical protein
MIVPIYKARDLPLERLLLARALDRNHTGEVATRVDKLKEKIKEWSGVIIGLLLAGIGWEGLLWCPNNVGQRISEALLISGILTVTVDPFLKRHLVNEATKDIFHHLLGFDLPIEIKERIKRIVLGTNLYRKDMTMICSFEKTDLGVCINIDLKFEVINPTHGSLPFKQTFGFPKSENATLHYISCSEGPKGYGSDLRLDEHFGYEAKGVKIKPNRPSGQRVWFTSKYSVRLPCPGSYTTTFANPTIGFYLQISNPPGLNVSSNAGKRKGNDWINEEAFMPGDHFDIEWEPVADAAQEGTTLKTAPREPSTQN